MSLQVACSRCTQSSWQAFVSACLALCCAGCVSVVCCSAAVGWNVQHSGRLRAYLLQQAQVCCWLEADSACHSLFQQQLNNSLSMSFTTGYRSY
jgi:hypothetical protein